MKYLRNSKTIATIHQNTEMDITSKLQLAEKKINKSAPCLKIPSGRISLAIFCRYMAIEQSQEAIASSKDHYSASKSKPSKTSLSDASLATASLSRIFIHNAIPLHFSDSFESHMKYDSFFLPPYLLHLAFSSSHIVAAGYI